MAASARLEGLGACFRWVDWQQPDDELWTYLKCKHPHEMVGGMEMHSYAYVRGEYAGNGFTLAQTAEADLTRRLSAAGARMDCKEDCDALAPAEERAQLAAMLRQPMALLGWSGCPCTNIARSRFEGVGACYVQTVWPTDDAPLYKHLQCKYGRSHHSFVFAGGAFIGDGFALQESRMGQPEFNRLLDESRARLTCQRKGDENLAGKPLMPCTQSNDGSTTGWARTGSCNWDPSDSGYHEVCVTMSDEFLKASARHDANDLSSVVSAGGHWCICAWAWASAVSRDPTSYEGITLDCGRTNLKLREVYESHIASGADLRSPSGAAYKAKAALDAVNRVCSGGGNGNTTTAARLFAAGTTTTDATAASALPAVEAVDGQSRAAGGGGGSAGSSAGTVVQPDASATRERVSASLDRHRSGNGRGASAMLALVGFAALAVIGALFGVRQLRRRPTSTEREQLTPHLAAKRRAHERESPAATDFSDAEAADDKLGFYDSGMECADSAGEDGGGVVRVGATPSTGSLLRGVESDARC